MTTLYTLLNRDAKAWWYYKRLREWGRIAEARAEERKSIRRCIQHVRTAASGYGYLLLLEEGNRFILTINNQNVLSGYGAPQHYVALCQRLGVPVFDLSYAPGGDRLIWDEPLDCKERIAYYKEKCNA